jgi:flagellar hook-basal body complex protein FliE
VRRSSRPGNATGADQYARSEFSAAEDALKRARDAVDQRDYRLALNNALDARERAQNASRETSELKAAARTDAERELLDAMTALNDANAKLRTVDGARTPVKAVVAARRVVTDSDGILQKARAAFDRGDYPAVIEIARPTTQQLRAATHDLEPAGGAPARRRR